MSKESKSNKKLLQNNRAVSRKSPINWNAKLYERVFTEEELEEIVNEVDLMVLLKTHSLSLKFIFDNILDISVSRMSVEEGYISYPDIAKYQPYTIDEIREYGESRNKK